MMPEISLNVLDVAENSIRAEAALVKILVTIDPQKNQMMIQIIDDGKGMTEGMGRMIVNRWIIQNR